MPAPLCTVLPLPDHQVSFRVGGRERLRWHFGPGYPRPFFYPLAGPASGESLTRVGHPGDPGHDHHRSIWFAHEKVSGVNFWLDAGPARVRQLQWLAYHDGDAEAVLAVKLGWFDGHDPKELLTQELIAGVAPGPRGETFLELQSTFRPAAGELEFGQTNFGFLGVRVAKALSEHWGDGKLTNSDGATGEAALFGKPAAWVDYGGESVAGRPEGVTYFDHPSNPGSPAAWHVRADGWMGASATRFGPLTATASKPLVLRYLLHAHRGAVEAVRAAEAARDFAGRPAWRLVKRPAKHETWGAVRG